MSWKKRHWIWNVLIVFTLLACGLAFAAHYKNWVKVKDSHFRVLSGIYYQKLPYSSLDTITMVDKIPSMERLNGFSAWMKEKGVFRDSLHPENKVYVYVDELGHPKIRLVHHDSLVTFLNMSDSTKTREFYEFLLNRKEASREIKETATSN